jgi:uncharacterized protein
MTFVHQGNSYYHTGMTRFGIEPPTFGQVLAIALLVALAVGIGGIATIWTRYRKPTRVYKYPFWEKGNVRLTAQSDVFVNKTLKKRTIKENTGAPYAGKSSGGFTSGGRISAGGRIFGGGGRKF